VFVRHVMALAIILSVACVAINHYCILSYKRIYYTSQQNLTFIWHTGEISVPNRKFIAEFKHVSSFFHHPRFFCDSQVKCAVLERHTLRLSRMPSSMNRSLSHSLTASELITTTNSIINYTYNNVPLQIFAALKSKFSCLIYFSLRTFRKQSRSFHTTVRAWPVSVISVGRRSVIFLIHCTLTGFGWLKSENIGLLT
jgi:hypothetical protein